jgi:hypothetical protein
MPYFVGSAAKRSYLLDAGYRYLAFVRPELSRYAFRRGFWLWRVYHDIEFFQMMSAYSLDASESFTELAGTTNVLYDRDGLVVLDLDGPHGPVPSLPPAGERARRDLFLSVLSEREGLSREWLLTTRKDVYFASGFSGLVYASPVDAQWFQYNWVPYEPDPFRGIPSRWMARRSHLRLHGEQPMRLVLRGAVQMSSAYTRPRLDVSLDGELLASVVVDEGGTFTVDVTIDASRLHGWTDLYMVWNAISQPEREARDLRIARLEVVEWVPR